MDCSSQGYKRIENPMQLVRSRLQTLDHSRQPNSESRTDPREKLSVNLILLNFQPTDEHKCHNIVRNKNLLKQIYAEHFYSNGNGPRETEVFFLLSKITYLAKT